MARLRKFQARAKVCLCKDMEAQIQGLGFRFEGLGFRV